MRNNNSKVFEFQMQIFVNICKVTIHTLEIMTRFLERDGIKCVLQKIYRRFGLQSVTPRITDRIMHSRLYSYEVPKRASRARFTKKKTVCKSRGHSSGRSSQGINLGRVAIAQLRRFFRR